MTWSHEPQVEICVEARPIAELHFRVDLALEIESAILTIRDGKIRALSTGACKGTGTLRCEGLVLARASRAFAIPGSLSFREGIPLTAPAG